MTTAAHSPPTNAVPHGKRWNLPAPAQASSASQASIDGHALMVARVFGNYEPPVAQPPLTSYNLTQSSYHFLNRDDRAVISQMYCLRAG